MNYIYYLMNGKFPIEKPDKKILKVLKEQRNFPINLPKPIKLSKLVNIMINSGIMNLIVQIHQNSKIKIN